MHIGVDATCWANTRGYGRHARSLLGSMVRTDDTHRYTFFVDSEAGVAAMPANARIERVSSARPAALAACADGHRSAADLWRMAVALSARGYDALVFPTIYSYVPVWSKARKIVVVHDVIPERYPHLTIPR